MIHSFALFGAGSNAALYTFLLYTLSVFVLAWAANRLLRSKSFMSEYFLGGRSLGVWAFALTFAATSASGGSFTGFPAKIYSHGWVLALWIASYMVVPLCAMGLLAKRINQTARVSGAITVPDVVRDRFQAPGLGLLSTLLIVFFISFNLVAQFKAGSLILQTLLHDVPVFHAASASFGQWKDGLGLWAGVDPEYLVCLLGFSALVIVYTTYGGFHAVVWTDVMQGVVMVVGVLILLPLTLSLTGGLEPATRTLAEMTPPRRGTALLWLNAPAAEDLRVPAGKWFAVSKAEYLDALTSLTARESSRLRELAASGRASQADVDRALAVLKNRPMEIENGPKFRLLRVASTKIIRRGAVMIEKAHPKTRGMMPDTIDVVELTTDFEIEQQLKRLQAAHAAQRDIPLTEVELTPVDMWLNGEFTVTEVRTTDYLFGGGQPGHYVTGPGPESDGFSGFLPLSLAVSFFFMWSISGAGQPSNMVRLMAFSSSAVLRRSMFTVAIYYSAIYFPLVVIFCCARVLLPGMDSEPDSIMPQMALHVTHAVGQGWLAGLLMAAPFAAVMSTVDSFLLMVSSALVRDLYQRNINPHVKDGTIKWMSYVCTFVVGAAAMWGAVNPPQFLQDIIVYTGSGLAACFLGPVTYAMYWPRMNKAGMYMGMLSGFAAHVGMYLLGYFANGSFFKPYLLFNLDPILIGLFASFTSAPLAAWATRPPSSELVQAYFFQKIPK